MFARNYSFFLIYVIIVKYSLTSAYAQGTWQQKDNFAGNPRFESVAFSIDSKAYLGTGSDGTTPLPDWWEYDSNTNSWTQKADLTGGGRWGAVGFAIQGKGYICTGKNVSGAFLNDLWEYDPISNFWTQKKDFPGQNRQHATSFVINNLGYIVAGITETVFPARQTFYKDTWAYEPATNNWIAKPSLPGDARQQAVGFSLNDQAIVVSGTNETDQLLKDNWRYDASLNQWTQMNSLDFLNELPEVGFATQTNGYIHTGEIDGFWEYQFSNDNWLQKPGIGTESTNSLTATSIQNRIFLYNGTSSNSLTNTWWEFVVNNLAEPSNLQAVVVSSSSIKLTWLDNSSEETGYVIERTQNETIDYQPIQTLTSNTNEFIDRGLASGQIYFYRVRARKNEQFSQYSNRIGAVTTPITSISQHLKSQIKVKTINQQGIFIISPHSLLSRLYISVYSKTGKLIQPLKRLQKQTRIDLSEQTSGLYYLVLIQDNKQASIPLFKP